MKKGYSYFFWCLGFLLVASVFLGFYIGFVKSTRVIFGFFYIVFLPGLLAGFLLLPSLSKHEWWERVFLAVPFSFALVSLVITYVHLAGVPLNALTIFIITSVVILTELILIGFFNRGKNDIQKGGYDKK